MVSAGKEAEQPKHQNYFAELAHRNNKTSTTTKPKRRTKTKTHKHKNKEDNHGDDNIHPSKLTCVDERR